MSAACPATSGSEVVFDVTTATPAGHGLQHRHAEAFGQAGVSEHLGVTDQGRKLLISHVLQEAHVVLQVQPIHLVEDNLIVEVALPDHDQWRQLEPWHLAQARVGAQQRDVVFSRLDPPDGADVSTGVQAPGDHQILPLGSGKEAAAVHSVAGDGDAVRVEPVQAGHFAARVVADGEQQGRLPCRPLSRSSVPSGQTTA